MKCPSVFSVLFCGALLSAPRLAASVPAPPPTRAVCAQTDVLVYFDRLPAHHFAPFGNTNRRQLLKRRGTVLDHRYRFIELSVAEDPAKNNGIWRVQISVFRSAGVDFVAVSRLVWNQPRVKGTLHLYRVSGEGALIDVTRTHFPYRLGAERDDKGRVIAENATLPRRGTEVYIGVPETGWRRAILSWREGRFVSRAMTEAETAD